MWLLILPTYLHIKLVKPKICYFLGNISQKHSFFVAFGMHKIFYIYIYALTDEVPEETEEFLKLC